MLKQELIKNVIVSEEDITLYYFSGRTRKIKDVYLLEYFKKNELHKKFALGIINELQENLKTFYKEKNILTFRKFIKILENNCNSYFYFKNINFNGVRGCAYWLSSPLSPELKNLLKKGFKNIEFLKAFSQYAPEVKRDVIFIGPKKWRSNNE